MPTVVGIRFKKACKIYYFDPAETGVARVISLSWKQLAVWNTARLLSDRVR